MELHFIGAAHNDPDGYNRTWRGLQILKPNIIALEWQGPEYEVFLDDPEIKTLRAKTEEAIRQVFREFQIDSNLYDQANAKSIWGGEVRAAQDFARQHGIEIIPTESAQARINVDMESFHNSEITEGMFREWLASLKAQGEIYNPDKITAFDPAAYDMFERHLDDKMTQEEIDEVVKNSMWAFKPERVEYQTEKLRIAIRRMGENDRLVHVGGFLHLMDDGLAQVQGPVNLWQHARLNLQCHMSRYSLSRL